MGAVKNLMIKIAEEKGVEIDKITNEDIKNALEIPKMSPSK
jgi:maleate cis-trans isomerase